MSRLNTTTKQVKIKADSKMETLNYEGAVAYKMDSKERLIEHVLGAYWNEDLFYTKAKKQDKEILKDIKSVAAGDPKFVLQLAAFARNVMYMRTTPQVLLVEAANINECKPFVREYTPKIVKRADELSEVIAYQLSAHGKPIPNSLKKGLAEAFATFDEYQLNKYDSAKKAVSLGNVLNLIARKSGWPVSHALWDYLVHDKVDEEALPKIAALKKLLAKDAIDEEAKELIKISHVTWETLISKFGSTKETWDLVTPNMGYMAKLRNLRNFVEKNVDLNPILDEIADPEQVKRSKQLPFRFLSAYNEVDSQPAKRAVAKALDASISNVTLSGKTAVIVDLSGSMNSQLSSKSKVSYKDVACVLGAIAMKKADESAVIVFADTAKVLNHVNPDDTLMTISKEISNQRVGGSTNAWAAFKQLNNMDKQFDRIILVSDMQCYDNQSYFGNQNINAEFKTYLKKYPNTKLYSIDMSAYGTKQTAPSLDENVVLLNGWSDKVIDFINYADKRNVMEQEIKKW